MSISIASFVLGPIGNNTYLISDTTSKKAAVVDPSVASGELFQTIQNNELELEYILITHAHFDHIGGVKWLRGKYSLDLKVALHSADLILWQEGGSSRDFGFDFSAGSEPNLILESNQTLSLGETLISAMHTPGHTPGHVTFSIENELAAFCGDLIFYHSIGRTDLLNSNENDLMTSIKGKNS